MVQQNRMPSNKAFVMGSNIAKESEYYAKDTILRGIVLSYPTKHTPFHSLATANEVRYFIQLLFGRNTIDQTLSKEEA